MNEIQMRSPAPRTNAGNRAGVTRNATSSIIFDTETEANLAALYVIRRFGLSKPLADVVATLAGLGRAFA